MCLNLFTVEAKEEPQDNNSEPDQNILTRQKIELELQL